MSAGGSNARSALDKATETVNEMAEAVQATTDRIADVIKDGRPKADILDHLSKAIRQAPLRSLLVAFALGLIVGR